MQFGNKLVEGFFLRIDGHRWLECNSDDPLGQLNVLHFQEKSRNAQMIELFDDSREMWVLLNTQERRIYWSNDNRRQWNYIYDITTMK